MAKRRRAAPVNIWKYLKFCVFGAKDQLLDEDNGRDRCGAATIHAAGEGASASAGVMRRARIGTIDHRTIHRLDGRDDHGRTMAKFP